MRWLTDFSNEQLQQELEYTLLKNDCHCWWISKMQSGCEYTLEERYPIKFSFKPGKNAMQWKLDLQLWPRDRVPSRSMLALPDPRRPDIANPPTNFWWSLFLTALAWSTCTEFPLDRQSTRNIMLRFYGSSGRDSVRRSQHSSKRVSGISIRTMHQFTTPSLSQTIWPRWASRQFLTLPVTFGYSLSSETVVMRQLRSWKRLWRRSLTRSHKRTSMGSSRNCWNDTTSALQLQENLFWRGLEFHVCTISKSAHT